MRQRVINPRLKPVQSAGDTGEEGQQARQGGRPADVAPSFGAEVVQADENQDYGKAIEQPIEIGEKNPNGEKRCRAEIVVGIGLDEMPTYGQDSKEPNEQERTAPPCRRIDPSNVGAEQEIAP